jgi:23S rRNA pseudouridine1911/1915/1917 synthase
MVNRLDRLDMLNMLNRLNRGYRYEERLGGEASGCTVLDYLSERYRHSSTSDWSQRIAAGRVLVDGVSVGPTRRLSPGQRLAWQRPPWVEPPAPSSFAVLYRDADVLAVAKPRGLAAMPGGLFLERTLLRRVRAYDASASPLHRLGRGTSGITLFTRHRQARRVLADAWQRGEVKRHYLGLIRGRPLWEDITIDEPIGQVAHPHLGTVAAIHPDGKPAKSHVRVLGRRQQTSLVAVTIETGRTHQIRIHLAALGVPLEGDPLYPAGGVPDPATRSRPGELGYWLHADTLRFPHPSSGATVTLTCQPPPLLR